MKEKRVHGGADRVARILIVDDEPDLRFMMRTLFEHAGYEVVEARDGLDGLRSVRNALPDLVVTDLVMPRMDGAEFIGHLRGDPATSCIPILVVSANSELVTAADAAVTKPFDVRALVNAVSLMVEMAATA